MQIPPDEFDIPFFRDNGFLRKLCPICGEHYWTQDEESNNCGDAPCCDYSFIGNSPANRKFEYGEMREKFLSYFEQNDHARIAPYPIVARWRDDLMFTIASIIDFQPYVTDGLLPPPANPLVVSQPCLRFEDIDLVGITAGRHHTIFEMGGHHAFNYKDGEQVYWKNETVDLHHGLALDIGISSEDVNYKEGIWSGGGNAGYCLEPVVGGNELSTLVFMEYRVVGDQWERMPIQIVDTGYGIERWTWITTGESSAFHAIYGNVLDQTLQWAGINPDDNLLSELAKYSYLIDLDNKENERKNIADKVGISYDYLIKALEPVEAVYAALDHTKAMTFILSEGVVPSNVKEGYLTRMLFRRGFRLLRRVGIEDRLGDLVNEQIEFWGEDYPQIKRMQSEILEMVESENKKYRNTLSRGKGLVQRYIRRNKVISKEQLIEFYESHGLTPEDVQEAIDEVNVDVDVPGDFYTLISSKHMEEKKDVEIEEKSLDVNLDDVPLTRKLFYEDPYLCEFDAEILDVVNDKYVVLDKTAFYAEGGGQISDRGYLIKGEKSVEVVDVQSIEGVIFHEIKEPILSRGDTVHGKIDWERRIALMRAHTSTHIILGAARRVLGEHAWQAGASKSVERARLDLSHYERITRDQLEEIERLSNSVVREGRPVHCKFMQRDEAEKQYGLRLYQGGAVPGKEIRIVDIGDWDVEACGGTHLANTSETGFIKILNTERVQDGVERLVYASGPYALEEVQKREALLMKAAELMGAPYDNITESITNNLTELKELKNQLDSIQRAMSKKQAEKLLEKADTLNGVKLVFYSDDVDIDYLIELGNALEELDPRVVAVMFSKTQRRSGIKAGEKAQKLGIHAGNLTRELAKVIGGGGGGAPYFGQGGGGDPAKFSSAYGEIIKAIKKELSE